MEQFITAKEARKQSLIYKEKIEEQRKRTELKKMKLRITDTIESGGTCYIFNYKPYEENIEFFRKLGYTIQDRGEINPLFDKYEFVISW